jgi:solute carrier family 25 protein 39/40
MAKATEAKAITPLQQMASSCTGALATSLLMTPLDVVKTRLQAQSQVDLPCIEKAATALRDGRRQHVQALALDAGCPKCSFFMLNNGLMEQAVPVAEARQLACETPYFRGTSDAFVQIARREGVASLYNGLSPTLAMAVPATVLYFTTYDNIRARVARRLGAEREWLAPVLAGSSARTIATTLISPLELVRTIMMAERTTAKSAATGGLVNVVRRVGTEIAFAGPQLLFRGLIPSLWKDVPFSAIYWLGYEQLRAQLLARHQWPGKAAGQDPDLQAVFRTSFAAGACSGTFAALLTTPFDVIKTRQQVFLFDRAAAVPSTLSTVCNSHPAHRRPPACAATHPQTRAYARMQISLAHGHVDMRVRNRVLRSWVRLAGRGSSLGLDRVC